MLKRSCAISALALVAAGMVSPAWAGSLTDWPSAVQPDSVTDAFGVATRMKTTPAGPGLGVKATPDPERPPGVIASSGVTYMETRDAKGDLSAIVVRSGSIFGLAIEAANGDTFTRPQTGFILARASDWTRQVLMPDVTAAGLHYASFAAWRSGVGAAVGEIGAGTFGARNYNALPASGSARFTGLVGGVYVDPNGGSRDIVGDLRLNVDFSYSYAGSGYSFESANMRDLNGSLFPQLTLRGAGSVIWGHAGYAQVETDRLTGTGELAFYGPNHEEAGGAFALAPKSGDGLERFVGAFAARRGDAAPVAATPIAPVYPAAPPPTFALPTGFASWSTTARNASTVELAGKSVEIAYTANGAGLTSASDPSAVMDTAVSEMFNAVGTRTALKAQNNNRSVSFYLEYGDTLTPLRDQRFTYARASDWTRHAIIADGARFGWDYQSFGVWETGIGSGTGSIGAVSYGAATPAAAIPTTGTARFDGYSAGLYTDASGRETLVTGLAVAYVEFGVRTLDLAVYAMNDRQGASVPVGASGLLSWNAGRNDFSGRMSGTHTGEASGRFYGPKAQELGGVVTLRGPALERFVGAFGARRP